MIYYFSEQISEIIMLLGIPLLHITRFNRHLGRFGLCLGVSCHKISDNVEVIRSEVST